MTIYLIRHAHAVDATEDPKRPLSKRGRKQVRTLARFLRSTTGFQPAEIWQSPLARSKETAEQLQQRLGLPSKLVTFPELETSEGVAILAEKLNASRRSLVLVGHEPHLSDLATLLLTGQTDHPVVVMKKGAILALTKTSSCWTVNWLVHPDLLAP